MSARSGITVPHSLSLPLTPRGGGSSDVSRVGFARRALMTQSQQKAEGVPFDTVGKAPHAPLRPPTNEGYKRSAGLLRTLDMARIGSAGPRDLPQSARTSRITSVNAKNVPSAPRVPALPVTARPYRPEISKRASQSVVEANATESVAQTPADGSMGRMLPSKALELFEAKLCRYERREILDYDEVFFVGASARKIDAPIADVANFGYDDDKGDYNVVIGDHIAYRYEVVGALGKGSFGQVLHVKDHKKGTSAALKLIRNKKRFHQQAMVEIKILDHLRCRDPDEKSCTVRMLNYFKFRSHTVITFDMHSINLYELTKLNGYQPFAPALIKRFSAQLLVSLAFMWQEQIVHCDIKPENILLRHENKTSLKLIDFGSSCFENERVYTYIQSRFYRAPEIILGVPYGKKIDMWSLGCVICEMQMGLPIFPGESENEQMQCIMEVFGVPPTKLLDRSSRKGDFFESNGSPKLNPNSRGKIRKPGTRDLAKALRTDDIVFVDFMRLFLQWEPTERATPHDAMRHPWITECFKHSEVKSAEGQDETQKERRRSSVAKGPDPKNPTPQLPAIEKR